jgi:hypothetical protein
MKTFFYQRPAFYSRGPEEQPRALDPYFAKFVLQLTIVLALFGSTLWYIFTVPTRKAGVSAPQARLELSLSGTYPGNLSLGQNELSVTQCGPASFSVVRIGGAALPLELTFKDASSQKGFFFMTSAQDNLSLTLAGTRYTLQSGSVAVEAGVRAFYATFRDPQGQPLVLSGRLFCL